MDKLRPDVKDSLKKAGYCVLSAMVGGGPLIAARFAFQPSIAAAETSPDPVTTEMSMAVTPTKYCVNDPPSMMVSFVFTHTGVLTEVQAGIRSSLFVGPGFVRRDPPYTITVESGFDENLLTCPPNSDCTLLMNTFLSPGEVVTATATAQLAGAYDRYGFIPATATPFEVQPDGTVAKGRTQATGGVKSLRCTKIYMPGVMNHQQEQGTTNWLPFITTENKVTGKRRQRGGKFRASR